MSILEQVQQEIYQRLLGEDYLSAVPIFLARKKHMDSEVEQALNVVGATAPRKPGACVLVLMPSVDVPHPGVPGPPISALFTCRVLEQPEINLTSDGTNLSAEDISLFLVRSLAGWQLHGISNGLVPGDGGRNVIIPVTEVVQGIGYDVHMSVEMCQVVTERVAAPRIEVGGQFVIITSRTTDATIYYTTDGSFPGPGNVAAQTYTGPISFTPGTTYRAGAVKSGMTGSDITILET